MGVLPMIETKMDCEKCMYWTRGTKHCAAHDALCIGFPDKPCGEFRPKTDDAAKALTACRAKLAVVQRRYTRLWEEYVCLQTECDKLKGEVAWLRKQNGKGARV